eukprot:gene2284-2500_t
MEKIKALKKPPPSLIKLIESIGILLNLSKSYWKSGYKVSIPTNYDATLAVLATDFYDHLSWLTNLPSEDIDNEVASDFFNKMLEPGVDYEEAINCGGLVVRELYNVALLVLLKLQSDVHRVPVYPLDVLCVVDGSRASFIALDNAVHICKYGQLHVLLYTENVEELSHLEHDIQRRCRLHYKLPDHRFVIHNSQTFGQENNFLETTSPPRPSSSSSPPSPQPQRKFSLESCLESLHIKTVVLPYGDHLGQLRFLPVDTMQRWAVQTFSGDAVLCQNMSYVRPFTEVECSRTFVVFIDQPAEGGATLLKAIKYFRPGDCVILTAIFLPREPIGDNRELRFDFGERQDWIRKEEEVKKEPLRLGWNDQAVEDFTQDMDNLLSKSFLTGRIRIERTVSRQSIAQTLGKVAREENAMGIMMTFQGHEDALNESIADMDFTVFVLK